MISARGSTALDGARRCCRFGLPQSGSERSKEKKQNQTKKGVTSEPGLGCCSDWNPGIPDPRHSRLHSGSLGAIKHTWIAWGHGILANKVGDRVAGPVTHGVGFGAGCEARDGWRPRRSSWWRTRPWRAPKAGRSSARASGSLGSPEEVRELPRDGSWRVRVDASPEPSLREGIRTRNGTFPDRERDTDKDTIGGGDEDDGTEAERLSR